MREKNACCKSKKPCAKTIIAIGLICILIVIAILAFNRFGGDDVVEFNMLSEEQIPQDIVGQVIPEYRGLERALACMVDDKVYVVVSRGEKPTSGFEVDIDNIIVEESDGQSHLTVYAMFKDPEPGTALTQILTYPVKVAETSLQTLPDTIELRVQY